jgi:hypothetical protein
VTHMIHFARRATRTTAVLLTVAAPLFVAGCSLYQPPADRAVESSGSSVPPDSSTQLPAVNGFAY